MDLRQSIAVLRARWVFFVLTFVLGLGLTGYFLLTAPAVYTSTATLFVSTPSQIGVTNAMIASITIQERARSYAELVDNDRVLDRAAAEIGGISAEALDAQVSAEFVESTLLIDIEGRAGDADRAQELAAAVADEVIAEITRLQKAEGEVADLPFIVELASKASHADSSAEPRLLLGGGTGVMLSLMVALCATIIREVLDTSVKSSRDVNDLTGSLPLSVVPQVDSARALADSLRHLRTNLQFADLDSDQPAGQQTILVTSPAAGEGKSFLAAHLATALASTGVSVILVETDLRPGSRTKKADEDDEKSTAPGLVSVLLGEATLAEAVRSEAGGVDLLPRGALPPNPAEMAESRALRDLLTQLRTSYHTVVIDAPALLPVADATSLLKEADGVVLVVQYGVTRREQVRQAVSRVHSVGARLFGVVLNGAPQGAADGYGYETDEARSTRGQARAQARGRRVRR